MTTGDDTQQNVSTPEGRNLTAKTLIGNRVKNAQGEALGKVEDLMLDLEAGRIAYAVVNYGGVMGVGNKLFAVPWSAFTLDTDDHTFVLEVGRDVLDSDEGFDKTTGRTRLTAIGADGRTSITARAPTGTSSKSLNELRG